MKLIVAVLLVVLPLVAYRQGRVEVLAANIAVQQMAEELAAIRDQAVALETRSMMLERQATVLAHRVVVLMEEVRLDTRPQPEPLVVK